MKPKVMAREERKWVLMSPSARGPHAAGKESCCLQGRTAADLAVELGRTTPDSLDQ